MILDTQETYLVQQTFTQVVPVGERTAQIFYDRLFELDPEIKDMFHTENMRAQGMKLIQMIGMIVTALHTPDLITPTIQDLARRHLHYGVKKSHYQTLGEALMWTLREVLGSKFTYDVQMAWQHMYEYVAHIATTAAYQTN